MSANTELQKALLLLDRGRVEHAEHALRNAISQSEAEGRRGTLVTALCALGDLWWQQGRDDEAVALLRRVLVVGRDYPPAGAEVARATELLAAHGRGSPP